MTDSAGHYSSDLAFGRHGSIGELPASFDRLFEATAAREGYYHSRTWYDAVTRHGMTEDGKLKVFTVDAGASPLLVLPALMRRGGYREAFSKRVESFSSFYTCHFTPIINPDIDVDAGYLRAIIRGLELDGIDILRFPKFDPADPLFDIFAAALRNCGFKTVSRLDFGNWRESVRSDGYDSYIARRPSRLRKHIRRYKRNLEEECGPIDFQLVCDETGLDQALADYWRVYEMSWKGDEARPDFVETIIRKSAAEGKLRLGVLKAGGETVAVKLAFLDGGVFSQFKAAYNPEFNAFGPGTLINDLVFERVLSSEPVREFEFGNGDEPHKSKWASERRERWTLTAFNFRTVRGRTAYALAILSHALRRVRLPFLKRKAASAASAFPEER